MSKSKAKDLDNLMRLITTLPQQDAERLLRDVKREKDPEEKRKMIEHALRKKGMKPL